jgi:hypothetical protein
MLSACDVASVEAVWRVAIAMIVKNLHRLNLNDDFPEV